MNETRSQDRIKVRTDLPQPTVVAEPRIFADHSTLSIRYRTSDETVAMIRFPLCSYVIFGAPNDEALGGHPLGKRGLKFYSVHEIENSSLIQELERRNSVHPQHDRERYLKDKKHYIFTFQDSTLECVVSEGQWWVPTVRVCVTEEEADTLWPHCKDA
jgi:hypothetical protein